MKRRRIDRKAKPANEITEQEIEIFLRAIKDFKGYPRVRDLATLIPSLDAYKINIVLRYLERSKMIIVDNDGYITWIRTGRPNSLTLGDVANIDARLKDFLEEDSEN